jgi:TonB family protein
MKSITPLLALGIALAGCVSEQPLHTQPEVMTTKPGAMIEGAAIPAHAQPGLAPDQGKPGDSPPVALMLKNPVYPYDLQKAGVTGVVIVDFIVGPDGSVVRATAISSPNPEFSVAAVDAVLQCKFRPGMKGGKHVFCHLRAPITFALHQRRAPNQSPEPTSASGTPAAGQLPRLP